MKTRTAEPAPQRPQGCTNFKLRQLLRRVAHLYDSELAQAGLKSTQYSLLSQVLYLQPVRPADLAQAMTLDASTLTRNLKPLVAAGWLVLEAGPDARSRLVRLTEAGRAKRSEAQRRWRTAQQRVNQLLGPERVLALHALVDESMGLLEPMPADAGTRSDSGSDSGNDGGHAGDHAPAGAPALS